MNEAYQTIEGLPLTDSKYDNAIVLLQERYSQPHKFIGAYMRALWELSKPNETIIGLPSWFANMTFGLQSIFVGAWLPDFCIKSKPLNASISLIPIKPDGSALLMERITIVVINQCLYVIGKYCMHVVFSATACQVFYKFRITLH